MTIQWYDYIGTIGVVLCLVAYFQIQTQRWNTLDLAYSALNLMGSLLIGLTLLYDFNLSALIIEVCWIAISIYGVWNYFSHRTSP
jgi:hypothetical protein